MDVIKYWQTIAQACGDPRGWHDLNLQEQQMVIESVNLLFFVLNNLQRNNAGNSNG